MPHKTVNKKQLKTLILKHNWQCATPHFLISSLRHRRYYSDALNMLSSSSAMSLNPSSLPHFFGGSSHFNNSIRLTRVSATHPSNRKFTLQCRKSEYYEQKQWLSASSPSKTSSLGASGGGGNCYSILLRYCFSNHG